MNPSASCRRLGLGVIVLLGALGAQTARAGSAVIGTSSYAYDGSSSARTYRVPSGANYVTVQAWGTDGYVQASYLASSGNSISVTLSSASDGTTTVKTTNGTVEVSGGSSPICSASGSPFNVTTDTNYTNGSGPSSPGAGNTYVGYVTLTASYATYTLTITSSPSGAGTATGAGTYAVGTNVAIAESAWSGYSAAGWGGAGIGSVASASSASSTIAMTANQTLVANFSPLVPAFTSSAATQNLVVGQAYSFQVAATQSPVFSAAGLPTGLAISSSGLISGTPTAVGIWSSTITASNDAVSVQEEGVAANEIVTISSSTLGNDLEVYAGALDIGVNGSTTYGFCIDPWHSSAEDEWLDYEFEQLASGPKVADGMGVNTALEIEQLWEEYFSPTMSDSTAAGLQIAIWDLVDASIGVQTDGASSFSLDSSDNYGANSMIAWVESDPTAAAADLYAVTGNGQDYAVAATSLPQPVAAAATATQLKGFIVYAQPAVTGGSATIPLGQAYVYGISATGSPSSYAASGLPPGLSVNAVQGDISGTPTATGTYKVTLTASNAAASGTGTLTLTVLPTYTLSIAASPSSAAGTATGAGTYMQGTTVPIQETAGTGYAAAGWGGTNAASVASPTSASTTVTLNGNYSLTADFSAITPVLSGGPPAIMLVGRAISSQVTATPAATISMANLPAGLTWNSVGAIGGSPTQTGSYTATISANNNGATASETAAVAVYPALSLPTASVTTDISQPFSYSVGAPGYGTTLTAASLPPGLSFSSATGVISGTPTATGTYTIALGAQNPATTAAGSVTVTVVQTYTLTLNSATGGTATGAGTYAAGTTVTIGETAASGYRAGGWSGPSVGSVASAASAATTIVMNGNATLTPDFVAQATLAIASATGGTATGGGTYDVGSVQTIAATPNSSWIFNGWSGSGIASTNSATTTITLTGNETITPAFAQTFTLALSTSPGASAGTASGSGTYVAGTTVQIQETPASGYSAAGWSGTDAGSVAAPGSASTSITMNGNYSLVADFSPVAPTIESGPPSNMVLGQVVSGQVTASPTSTITLGGLPPGVTSDPTGALGGTPTQTGDYTVTVTADNNGATASETVPVAVYPQPSLPTASATTEENETFTYSVGAPGFGTTLSAGSLPPGLMLDPDTGIISGTPTAPGTYAITLSESNPAASASGTLTLTVGQTYTLTIASATGGTTTGAGVYAPGTTVTVTETAAADYRTGGWGGTDSGSLADAADATTTIVMNDNYALSPDFVQQATLTIASATGGTAVGGGTFDVGSVQTITATPTASWIFSGWTGAGIASAGSASTTITITTDETITPAFTAVPTATITAPATAYSGSPLTVSSTASTPADNLTLHSIEWLSPAGAWTVSAATASGGSDSRTLGITFPTTGVWTVRGGASADGGVTWYYSANQLITVTSGITTYTLETMAVPAAGVTNWYSASPVVQQTYQVQHANP